LEAAFVLKNSRAPHLSEDEVADRASQQHDESTRHEQDDDADDASEVEG
jgi:hypothetical protein